MSNQRTISLLGFAFAIIVISGVVVRNMLGVAVVVRNDSSRVIESASIHVEVGRVHLLCRLLPGDRRVVFVNGGGGSRALVEYTDGNGRDTVSQAVGMFGVEDCGTATVSIRLKGLEQQEHVDRFCWGSWESILRLYI